MHIPSRNSPFRSLSQGLGVPLKFLQPPRFTLLDGPGAKKLGGPPHAQKNLQHSVPPTQIRGGPKKVGHTHSLQRYFTHLFLRAVYRQKKAEKRCIQFNNFTGLNISLLYACIFDKQFVEISFLTPVLHILKWKERCRELFNQYKEYLDELNRSLKIFESSVRTVEQSLQSDDYEDIIFWARLTEVGREKLLYMISLHRQKYFLLNLQWFITVSLKINSILNQKLQLFERKQNTYY